MFGLTRALVRGFGIVPVVLMLALIWVWANRSSQERSHSQQIAEERGVAEEDECFGALAVRTADSWPTLRITSVKVNSPAELAGIRAGDLITYENGLPLEERRLWQRQQMSQEVVVLSVRRRTSAEASGFEDLLVPVTLGRCEVSVPQEQ